MTLSLINNIAFLITLVTAGQIVITRFHNNPLNCQVTLGLLFGGVALLGMANPVNFSPGVLFDGRSIVLSVAGVVGGGVAALIAAVIAALYRYQLGGEGALVGVTVVLLSALLGVLARQWWLRRNTTPQAIHYLTLGVVVQLMQLAAFTQVPNRAGYAFIEQAWWVLLLFYPLASMLLCVIFKNYEQQLVDQQALSTAQKAVAAAETASRERFHAYFDHSIVGLAITSPQKGWIEVNDALCATLGYTRDELTRMTWTELTYPEDLAPDLAQFNRMLCGEIDSYTLDKRFIHKDGHLVDTHMGVSHVRKPDGSVDYVVAMVEDISERKLAEMALRLSQARLIDAQAVTKAGSWETDLSSLRVVWSAQTYTIFGLDPSTFQGSHPAFLEFTHPQDREFVDEAFRKSFESTATNTIEHRIVTTTGITKWVEERWRIERDDQGNPLRAVGTCQDITERKKSEEDLRESEYRWRFAIEGSGDGLWDWNIPSGVAYYSPRYKEMLGYADADIGTTSDEWSKRIHPEDAPAVFSAMQPYIDGKPGTATVEFRMLRKDGRWQWIFGRGMVMERDAQGKPLRMIGTITDITERKLTEAALRASETEFCTLAESMPQIVWITRPDGWNIYFNQQWMDYTGLTLDESNGHGWNKPFHPDDQQRAWDAWQNATQNDATYSLECRLRRADGAYRWWLIRGVPLKDASGKILKWFGTCTDIEEIKQTAETLQETQVMLARTEEIGKVGGWEFDIDTLQQTWTRTIYDIHEVDFTGHPTVEQGISFYTAESQPIIEQAVQRAIEHGEPFDLELEIITAKGNLRAVHTIGRHDPERGKIVGFFQDITERKRAEKSLQQAATVFGHTREGITITDRDGTIVDVNEAFTRITGYSREDAIGQNPRILSSGRQTAEFYKEMWDDLTAQGHWSGEVWNRRKDGAVYAELLSISATRDEQGVTQQYVAIFSDITAIKAHQTQLEHVAHFDGLTNLPNRVLLADRLHQAMAQAQRRQQHLVVVYLDLDGFKAVNDRYGHETGDQVLIVLAKRFKEALREGDTLARISGDEFVVVLHDLEDTSASLPLLNRLQAAAALPVALGELGLQVSASLGVTFYPQAQDIDGDQLLRQADQAMYQAKVAGKNRYCIFDAAVDSNVRKQHERLARIRLALERHEFVLYYQPKVNMRTGEVIGAEALIRWQHPEDGLLAPATFLPTIEDHPLAIDVGEWVIDTAMHQMEVWHAAGLDLPVSVNIGARQLLQNDFVERLQIILAKHPQVHPGCIELEVLETSALNDMARASQVIDDCAGIGVKFALDDFGTGYSSLTYLKRLRVTQLKIDQSFVRDMLDDPDDMAILQGIIWLAAAFKREVIAEGVETVEHGTALLQLGCELAQGYGIARPMPPDQLPGWAATWKPAAAWSVVISSGETPRSTNK